MNKYLLFFLILNLFYLGNYDNAYPESVEYGEILIKDTIYHFSNMECNVITTEGSATKYSLEIILSDPSKEKFNSLSFSVQDPNNNKYNLLKIGLHPATGDHWDSIRNHLREDSVTINGIASDEMEIIWKNIEVSDYRFSGEGYIHIKKKIEEKCADKIWVGGRYAKKGDPEYEDYCKKYCLPKYYYPPQKIWFRCKNGHY